MWAVGVPPNSGPQNFLKISQDPSFFQRGPKHLMRKGFVLQPYAAAHKLVCAEETIIPAGLSDEDPPISAAIAGWEAVLKIRGR